MNKLNPEIEFAPLTLPIRYENLDRTVEELGLNITDIIVKVDSAIEEINRLLQQINNGRNGKFKLFLGKSGQGKTTFLKTLDNFFSNIEVVPISRDVSLSEIPSYIKKELPEEKQPIFIIEDRDNPRESEEDLRTFFEEIRYQFRRDLHKILLIWPITDFSAANDINEIAIKVGNDSISSVDDCIYAFDGLPKEKYYETADITSKSINAGKGLESYGITQNSSKEFVEESDTIGSFYSRLCDASLEKIENTNAYLKNKTNPKVWILLPGDQATEIDRTVKSLTTGVKYRIDIERILAYLDDESNLSAYLNKWRQKRNEAAFLLRQIDLRLFPVSPSLSLAAIRAYAPDEVKGVLKNKKCLKSKAVEEIEKSAFYRLLLNDSIVTDKSPPKTRVETALEYLRIQANASKNDKVLNKALGDALIDTFEKDKYKPIINIEGKNIEGTNMKPDIHIRISDANVICLEPTWRTSGEDYSEFGIAKTQNTLTTGHIQKYVLDKAMEYINNIGL